MSHFLLILAVITSIPVVVHSVSPRNCSLIQCFPPVCKAGEILGPVPKGSCCPGCIPGPCENMSCALPLCVPGFTARVPNGKCCPECLPDCSTDLCKKPVCKTGQRTEELKGQCCPVCRPDCSAISCLRPTCKPGEKLEVPEGECCPVCVTDFSRCAAVSCVIPVCKKGEMQEVPRGECCPVCRPDCSAVSCLRPTCKSGEKLEVPSGKCCPICVRECKIEGQVFSSCASPCPSSCENPNPICITLCVRGCKCPPGQVINSDSKRCILPQLCAPKDNDLCSQPPEVGLCDGVFPRYFYNSSSSRCERFIFGGCGGNDNNFKTRESCARRCSEETRKCLLSPEVGPCKALIPRFFYNSTTGRCERFFFGGCQGNSNNFISSRQCNRQCGDVRCFLPPVTGPCEALIQRYFHNATSRRCERFTYGGCQGNSNNFVARRSCERACDVRVDRCSLPSETGPCRARIVRYFHNSKSRMCERFVYGGCRGNRNNFVTRQNCERACNVQSSRCSLPPEIGPCRAFFVRYFHNSTSGRCEKFIYGGCRGNSNNFLTRQLCEKACDVDRCSLLPEVGPCRARLVRYFHNSTTRRCEQFIYGGCGGNSNNFRSRERCERACDALSPCAAIFCLNGFRCAVENGEAFCNPDCNLNNGGCLANQTCRLQDVVCVRAPCPPARICEANPCATVRCANGFRCKVSNGKAFCDPDCSLNNGGCPRGQICRLQNVTCVTQPCPPVRLCRCPPQCSRKFCRRHGNAVCSNPGPREIPGCTGNCQLTYCRACYFARSPLPLPGDCAQCDLRDYQADTRCYRRWSKCIEKAHRKENGLTFRRFDRDFRCYLPDCPLKG